MGGKIAGAHARRGSDLEVVSGRKRPLAGAGDNGDPLLGIAREVVEHLAELDMRRGMERVHDLGAVQGDDGQTPVALDFAEFVLAHVMVPYFSGNTVPRPNGGSKACVTF